MNKFAMVGSVFNIKTKKIESGTLTNFGFSHAVGQKINNLTCATFNKKISRALREGQQIELVDYVPLCNVSEKNGYKFYYHIIQVREIKILSLSGEQDVEYVEIDKDMDTFEFNVDEAIEKIERQEQQEQQQYEQPQALARNLFEMVKQQQESINNQPYEETENEVIIKDTDQQ